MESLCISPSPVLSDLPVVDKNSVPSRGTLPHSLSVPNISTGPFTTFNLVIQTAWSPLDGRDAVVHKARHANATDRIWGKLLLNDLRGSQKEVLLCVSSSFGFTPLLT